MMSLKFEHTNLTIQMVDIVVPSRIQTWNLTVCLYLNLKHGDLDHSTIMAGSELDFSMILFTKVLKVITIMDLCPLRVTLGNYY